MRGTILTIVLLISVVLFVESFNPGPASMGADQIPTQAQVEATVDRMIGEYVGALLSLKETQDAMFNMDEAIR
jgi:hypothetical protein